MLQSREESMMDEWARGLLALFFLPSSLSSPPSIALAPFLQTIFLNLSPHLSSSLLFFSIFLSHYHFFYVLCLLHSLLFSLSLLLPFSFCLDFRFFPFCLSTWLSASHLSFIQFLSILSVFLFFLLSCYCSLLLFPQSLQELYLKALLQKASWINSMKTKRICCTKSIYIYLMEIQDSPLTYFNTFSHDKRTRWKGASLNSSWKYERRIWEALLWCQLCPLWQVDELCVSDRRPPLTHCHMALQPWPKLSQDVRNNGVISRSTKPTSFWRHMTDLSNV